MYPKYLLPVLTIITCFCLVHTAVASHQPINQLCIQQSTATRSILYVGGTGPGNYTTISEALTNATTGDTIYVYTGTYPEHLIISKEISLIGENRETTFINGGSTHNVVKITADNVTISGFTLQQGAIGLYCVNAHNSTIKNNNMMNNWEGIGFLNVHTASVLHCQIRNNYFEGINPYQSSNIIIKRNHISGNLYGIYLNQATNNLIIENQITGNTRGIEIRTNSNTNHLYHNNIQNSDEDNGFDECTNQWDNNYPSGGNYWDDYNGYDNNGDGIGDIPYSINGGSNNDNYPYMNPLTWNDPPVFGIPSPVNGSTNQSLTFTWSIPINDPEGDLFNWSIECNNGQTNQGTGASSGTKSVSLTNLDLLTTYTIRVNTTDTTGSNLYTREWFLFTTRGNTPPNTPNTPSPANHATDVDINADLNWIGGDPDPGDTVTYDVYFDTSSNPPMVSNNQTTTNYNPGTMNNLTTYYWKIVSWDNHGASTSGPLWDFTTMAEPNDPPYPPNNPNPIDGATDVSIETVLSWNCSDPNGDPLVYDVYFEADDPTPDILVSDDQTATTYDPGTLEYETIYYWQIIAKDTHSATTDGPIWHFTTEEKPNEPPNPPSITGRINGEAGISYPYTFTANDPDDDEVSYYIEWGDGDITDWTTFQVSGLPGYSESHIWDVEDSYIIRAKAKDIYGAESDWETLSISMPLNQGIYTISLFQRILERFPNAFPLLRLLLVL